MMLSEGLDDEAESYRARIGGVFVKMTEDELTEHLDKVRERAEREVDLLDEKIAALEEEQDSLKQKLYGRFGSQINLEY